MLQVIIKLSQTWEVFSMEIINLNSIMVTDPVLKLYRRESHISQPFLASSERGFLFQ